MRPTFSMTLAVRALRSGHLVAYPTEAVYGLGCDPLSPPALERVIEAKGRDSAKGLILIGCAPEQVLRFVREVPVAVLDRVLASWPGPNTWVMPAAPGVSPLVTGGRDTVAVRVTAHPVAAELCRRFRGALVSTSANRAGGRPARTAREVRRRLGAAVDVVLRGPLGGAPAPTAIRDAISGRVLRGGGSPS